MGGGTLPAEAARGKPGALCTDRAAPTAATGALVHRGWAGLGVAADVSEPGGAVPIDFTDIPSFRAATARGP